MTRVYFYAGPDDNQAFRQKIESMGLRLYKAVCSESGVPVEQDAGVYHGYISFQSPEELTPHGGPDHDRPWLISPVSDPLIAWHKSYTTAHEGDRYIIHGDLSWDFCDASRPHELAAGKRYFGQLSRWIRKNWPPARKRGTCRGPQAQKMIQFEAYLPRGLPPDATITYVEIPQRVSNESDSNDHPGRKRAQIDQHGGLPQTNRVPRAATRSWLLRYIVFPIACVAACLAILVYVDSL